MKRLRDKNVNTVNILLFLCVLAILFAAYSRYIAPRNVSKPDMDVSSLLTKTLNIAELYGSEYKYRGIAEIRDENDPSKIVCRACYSATVKAGINLDQIDHSIDENDKVMFVSLPEIDLKVMIADEEPLELLPHNADVDLDRLLRFCKEDAESEARASTELLDTARDNLRATIEGLYYQILKTRGYTVQWV